MNKNRIEAFSDGVLAIVITIMVLEMKVPENHGVTLDSLRPIIPVFMSYILSFSMVLIYWNNHHHLFQSVKVINGNVLLANGLLLFFLSLMPFTTAWMGENHFAPYPVMLFGIVLLMASISFAILVRVLIKADKESLVLKKAIGSDKKGIASTLLYIVAVGVALFYPLVSCAIYCAVALLWILPDYRIEKELKKS